jgi:dimethylglycine dehydrogenase
MMEKKAKVVVVGGGVVGVATLYHLAKKGWSDSVLLEAHELTSGSTWHAAGLLPLFFLSYSVGRLHKYSIDLYRTLEEETGLDVGFRNVGNIRLASTQDRMDEFNQYSSIAKTIGVEVQPLTPEEVKAYWPLCETGDLLGGIRHTQDGYIQPADVTQAMARGARNMGAKIYQHTRVLGFREIKGGGWVVETNEGEIEAEHVVTATGSSARRVLEKVGLSVPVISAEHQYIVTEPHAEILARKERGDFEMGVLRDTSGSWYMREEAGGLLLGPYEKDAPCCYPDGVADDAKYELFQGDLDRLEPHIESAIHRVPIFGEVGVKEVYNGAIPYTPDGNPMVGPAPGLRNFWLSEGHSFGVTMAGGAAWQLVEWMVEGMPSIDMLSLDPRRYGTYATKPYALKKNAEAIRNMFTVHYPNEERAAARPFRMSPCYDRMKALGAVFGQKFGWERPNWFAPEGTPQEDDWSFGRAGWFDTVGAECMHVHKHVGLLDMTSFAKVRLKGPGARDFLEEFFACRVPREGRVGLAHRLERNGSVLSEFTIYTVGDEEFYLVSAGGFTRIDHDEMCRHLPSDGSVILEDVTESYGVLVVAGPKSRALLGRGSAAGFSNKSFPWLSGREVDVGLSRVLALRVNFVGELGWELHHPISMQNHVFDTLMSASSDDVCLKPFGMRAMDSLRIEKSYRMIGTEFSTEYTAWESGVDRFIAMEKNGDFRGKEALLDQKREGVPLKLVTLEVLDSEVDAIGANAVLCDGEVVGRATSGNYGFRVGKSLVMAMMKKDWSEEGRELSIDILGKLYAARVVGESPFDSGNDRLCS